MRWNVSADFLVQQSAEAVAAIHDVAGQQEQQHQRQQQPAAPAHHFEGNHVDFVHIATFRNRIIAPPRRFSAAVSRQTPSRRSAESRACWPATRPETRRQNPPCKGGTRPQRCRRIPAGWPAGIAFPTSTARIKVSSAMTALMSEERRRRAAQPVQQRQQERQQHGVAGDGECQGGQAFPATVRCSGQGRPAGRPAHARQRVSTRKDRFAIIAPSARPAMKTVTMTPTW